MAEQLPDFPTNFTAFAEYLRLGQLADDNFIPVFASSNIKVLPYQIAAARFALRATQLKGCILCDEGSLGKTYEALLIIAQKCYEGKGNILIVLPTNLVDQWKQKIDEAFVLPFAMWQDRQDSLNKKKQKDFFVEHKIDNAYGEDQKRQRNLYITTYTEAIRDAEEIEKINWDLVVFDEADFLFKPENKSVITLKQAVGEAFKLLLTPTPITMSIMDIYGLVHFIDESVLPNAEAFYNRYFRKPERYGELSDWVSQFSFRTLKKQVEQYVGFSKRLPVMVSYTLSPEEKQLYAYIEGYIEFKNKEAFPEMDKYRLTLMFYHLVSSSPQALANMLDAPISRSTGEENQLLTKMQNLAQSIGLNSKAAALITTLKKIFSHLKSQKEPQKAVIFVENTTTLDVLYKQLKQENYSILKYKDTDALKEFRNNSEIQILITTDTAAKGLDLEYCPVIVNYDMLYNAMEMEQRICRCHRQGQQSDVLVVNMITQSNADDIRILELINKRTLQFGGIFGMSDEIIGNFDMPVEEVLKLRRKPEVIQAEIEASMQSHRDTNEQIVNQAESSLFTTFTKEIADKVTVTPQYIAEKSAEIRNKLWRVIRHFFQTQHPDCYDYDEKAQAVYLKPDIDAPLLYYANQRAYYSNKKYGLAPNFKPESCRITLISDVGYNIFSSAKCMNHGEIKVDADIEPCEISLFNVELRTEKILGMRSPWMRKGTYLKTYNFLYGKTASGRILSEDECRKILWLPVIECQESGEQVRYAYDIGSNKLSVAKIPKLEQEIINRYLNEIRTSVKEDAVLAKLKADRKKSKLDEQLADMRSDLKKTREALSTINNPLEELKAKKQINSMDRELKQREEGLFLEQLKIDAEMEAEIDDLLDKKKLFCDFYQMFNVKLHGSKA